jgi:hypothetical protein
MQALPCPATSLKPCITRSDGAPSYRLTIAGLGNQTLRFYDPVVQPFSSTRPRREHLTQMWWVLDRTTRPCVLRRCSPSPECVISQSNRGILRGTILEIR